MTELRYPALEARLLSTVSDHELCVPGDTVVVAVSGGPDSMSLLAALSRHRALLSIDLHVAHLNHQLREAAQEEAQLVQLAASDFGVPCSVQTVNVRALADETGQSLEDAARRARYAFLDTLATEIGATRVATGHTADDQIETLIMRIVRGTGLEGLIGIPYVRQLSEGSRVKVIRPLLDVDRAQVMDYCLASAIKFSLDESNFSLEFTRNRVRHSVLPVLDDLSKSFRTRALKMIELLSQDQDYLARAAMSQMAALGVSPLEHGVRLDRIEALGAMHPAIGSRIVRSISVQAGQILGIDGRATSERVMGLLARIHAGGNFTFELGGGLVAIKEYDHLTFTSAQDACSEEIYGMLSIPGQLYIPQLATTITCEIASKDSIDFSQDTPDSVVLDLDLITSSCLIARAPRKGDRFIPLGMKGSKKLQDFFVDIKIPPSARRRAIVLESDGTIIWLVHHRISATARVTDATRRVVRFSSHPISE